MPLKMELSRLNIPDDSCPQSEWQRLAEQLETLMQNSCQLRTDWSLTKDDLNQLTEYFYVNELLVQCLNLAYVYDREGITAQMFLPPKRNDDNS